MRSSRSPLCPHPDQQSDETDYPWGSVAQPRDRRLSRWSIRCDVMCSPTQTHRGDETNEPLRIDDS